MLNIRKNLKMNNRLFLIGLIFLFSCKNDVKETLVEAKWGDNLELALNQASDSDKIVMIDFMAQWCPPCKKMDQETFSDQSVIKKLNEFILLKIDVDIQQDVAKKYNGNARKYGGMGIPNILFLDKEKNIVHRIVGFHDAGQLISVMDSVLLDLL